MRAKIGEGRGYGPLCPEGEHVATVVSAEDGQTQAGKDKVSIRFAVPGFAPIFGTYVPGTSWWRELADAFPHCVQGDEIDTDLIKVGDRCTIEVTHERYDGKTRAKPTGLSAAPEGQDEELPF